MKNLIKIRNTLWFNIIGSQRDRLQAVISYYKCEKISQYLNLSQHDKDNTLYKNIMKNLKEKFNE
jgi:hypothetical protein